MNCKVMGIVNVTPDSFSDGGRYFKPEEAIRRAKNLIADGATIIDLGAESTRPGSVPIDWQTEWSRLEPVLEGLSPLLRGQSPSERGQSPLIQLSIDTYHPETAARSLLYGVTMINCVKSDAVPAMLEIVRKNVVDLVIPAIFLGSVPSLLEGTVPSFGEGTVPKGKGTVPSAGAEAMERLKGSVPEGVTICLDPMIGFGTTREEDLVLLQAVPQLAKLGPVLVGASRKRIIKKLTGVKGEVGKSIGGNVAMAVWSALKGASVVRVHDVRDTVEALRVIAALETF